jgi:NAD(P)-dependent dehydrogenase (short-subunit alcohol dehydrogenase family)
MSGRLAGKVAVVTGAGSGMGRAIVRQFSAQGAKVVAADVSGKQDDLPAELGDGCIATHADVSRSADVRAMLDLAVARFGRLDVLCNNAGIQGQIAPTAEHDEDAFDQVIAVNLRGVFLGMKYAIPLMLKTGGGSIVNTSSMASLVAFTGIPGY